MTVQIKRGDNGPECVPLHTAAEGLAVTEPDAGEFTITHLASGLALWPQWRYERPRYFDAALRAWAVALEAGIDWTQDVDSIKAALPEPERRQLYNRMRLAAIPPRRPRWHKGAQKRRLLPYEAATKREALRDATGLGDIGRDMWRDFWVYRRRGVMWGILPAVIRQPCKRFGVTREQREVQP